MSRKLLWILSSLIVASLTIAPAAQAVSNFGYLVAKEDGRNQAKASGGSIYYANGGIRERIRFRDLRADGDGAYGQADHQPYQKTCPPRFPTCYYAFIGNERDQTNRYGKAYGWRTSYLSEKKRGVSRWRTRASVCVDQNNEPDACDRTSYGEP